MQGRGRLSLSCPYPRGGSPDANVATRLPSGRWVHLTHTGAGLHSPKGVYVIIVVGAKVKKVGHISCGRERSPRDQREGGDRWTPIVRIFY